MAKALEKQVENVFDRMQSELKLMPSNRKALEEHLNWLRAKGSNPRTILKHLYSLHRFFMVLDRKDDVRRLDKKQLEAAISKINASELGEETKRNIKTIVKLFYRHLLGEDEYYPKQVAWIKTSAKKSAAHKLPEILTEEEVLKMIKVTRNPRDKCIIALLYDSGIRIGELLNLKIKNIDLTTEPCHITVDGKTGMRQIPITLSAPYIAAYINVDTLKELDPERPFLQAIGSWSNMERTIDRNAVAKVLKMAGERAGIKKRIYPHLFRHSRASNYANNLTEQQLKVFFGWTGDSRMASTYVHLSGRDIDNAVMKAYGREDKIENQKPKLDLKVCPKCREVNAVTAIYCTKCGGALDISTAVKQQELEKQARESAIKNIEDPEESNRKARSIRQRKGKK